MSIFLIIRDRLRLSVEGDEAEARRIMSSRRPVAIKSKGNDKDGAPSFSRTVIIRPKDILFAEVVSGQEELALAIQAKQKADEERKRNPNPGREPRLVPPQGRIV